MTAEPLSHPVTRHQTSIVAAASTIPVTNAAKQENSIQDSDGHRSFPCAHDGSSTFASFNVRRARSRLRYRGQKVTSTNLNGLTSLTNV
jgi:hypothetical protein